MCFDGLRDKGASFNFLFSELHELPPTISSSFVVSSSLATDIIPVVTTLIQKTYELLDNIGTLLIRRSTANELDHCGDSDSRLGFTFFSQKCQQNAHSAKYECIECGLSQSYMGRTNYEHDLISEHQDCLSSLAYW